MTVRLIIADAMTMSRMGYAAAIAQCSDIKLVADTSGVDQARVSIDEHHPDVIAIDADLPGFELARELRTRFPRLGILMTGPATNELVVGSLEAGLSGYLPRSSPVEVLLAAIRHAAAVPASFTSPLMASALVMRQSRSGFSPREQEVLELLHTGASLTAIAKQLQLTESTVRTYAARIYGKLNVQNRAEATRRPLG